MGETERNVYVSMKALFLPYMISKKHPYPGSNSMIERTVCAYSSRSTSLNVPSATSMRIIRTWVTISGSDHSPPTVRHTNQSFLRPHLRCQFRSCDTPFPRDLFKNADCHDEAQSLRRRDLEYNSVQFTSAEFRPSGWPDMAYTCATRSKKASSPSSSTVTRFLASWSAFILATRSEGFSRYFSIVDCDSAAMSRNLCSFEVSITD